MCVAWVHSQARRDGRFGQLTTPTAPSSTRSTIPSASIVNTEREQDVVVRRPALNAMKTRDNIVIIQSLDRAWDLTTQNRYNFRVVFNPDASTDSITQQIHPSVRSQFKNIQKIELCKVILPKETLQQSRSFSTPGDIISVKATQYPSVLIHIDELTNHVHGTNESLQNAFASVYYNNSWGNSANQSGGFLSFLPSSVAPHVINFQNPIAELTNMNIRITTPMGEMLSTTKDCVEIDDIAAYESSSPISLDATGLGDDPDVVIPSVDLYNYKTDECVWRASSPTPFVEVLSKCVQFYAKTDVTFTMAYNNLDGNEVAGVFRVNNADYGVGDIIEANTPFTMSYEFNWGPVNMTDVYTELPALVDTEDFMRISFPADSDIDINVFAEGSRIAFKPTRDSYDNIVQLNDDATFVDVQQINTLWKMFTEFLTRSSGHLCAGTSAPGDMEHIFLDIGEFTQSCRAAGAIGEIQFFLKCVSAMKMPFVVCNLDYQTQLVLKVTTLEPSM